MRLVTGIVNPFTRGPGLLAQSAAALQDLSNGRFVLGLGASSDVIVQRFNDIPFEKPLSKVREAVERLRPVLSRPRGEGLRRAAARVAGPAAGPDRARRAAGADGAPGRRGGRRRVQQLPPSLRRRASRRRCRARRAARTSRSPAGSSSDRGGRPPGAGHVRQLRLGRRVRGLLPRAGLGRGAGPDGRGLHVGGPPGRDRARPRRAHARDLRDRHARTSRRRGWPSSRPRASPRSSSRRSPARTTCRG